MKKLFLLLMLVLLLPSALAFDFDNVKEFESTGHYGIIRIKNMFGLGSVLAEFELLNNTDYCMKDCWAEGTATLYDNERLFRSIKFEDKNKEKKDVQKYKVKFYLWEVDKWKKYDGEELPAGTYSWRIEGKKDGTESIDWITNAFGIDLDDWAWWNATYNKRIHFEINASNTENVYNYPLHLPFNCVADCSDTGSEIALLVDDTDIVQQINVTTISSQYFNVTFKYNLTANTNLTVYGYFNNLTPVTIYDTDYNTVFYEYYEDFSTDVFATGDWNTTNPTNAYVNLTEGVLKMWDTDTTTAFTQPNHTRYPFLDILDNESVSNVRIRVNYSVAGGNIISSAYILYNRTSVYNTAYLQLFTQYSTTAGEKWYNTSAYTGITTNEPVVNVYQNWEYNMYNTTYSGFEVDGTELYLYNHPAGLPQTQIGMIQLYEGSVGGVDNPRYDVDYVEIYKNGLSPVISSSAPEQSPKNNTVFGLTIYPSTAYTNDTLICNYTVRDDDDSKQMVSLVQWYNGTNLIETDVDLPPPYVTNGTVVTETLSAETRKNEVWTCSAQLFSPYPTVYGDQVNITKTISNWVPTTPSIVSPADNYNTIGSTTLTCDGSIDIDPQDAIMYEFYGDTSNPPTTLLQNSTSTTATFTLTDGVPNYWRCLAHDNQSRSSYIATRSINAGTAYQCSTPVVNATQSHSLYFDFNNESNILQNLTVDYEASLVFSNPSNINENFTLNTTLTAVQNVSYCLSPANSTFRLDAGIRYVEGSSDPRYYYFRNQNVSNNTLSISMYSLITSLATPITFTVESNLGSQLENYLIEVYRHYLGTSDYELIAMGKTSIEGKDVIFLRQGDVDYGFIVRDTNGLIVLNRKTIDKKLDATSLTLKLGAGTSIGDILDVLDGLETELTFTNSTSTFSYTFSDPSGTTTSTKLRITHRTAKSEQVLLDETFSGNTAIKNYTIPSVSGSYIATVIRTDTEGNRYNIKNLIAGRPTAKLADFVGIDGVVATVWIFLTFAFMFINPVLVAVISFIGLLFSLMMGLLNIPTSALVGFGILVVGIIVMQMKRRT